MSETDFEATMQELERIVAELEQGAVALADLPKNVARGHELAKAGKQALDQIRGQIVEIMAD